MRTHFTTFTLVFTLIASNLLASSVEANSTEIMEATWYGPGMDCYQTKNGCEFLYADGDTFNMNHKNVVAIHRRHKIPMGTKLRITYPATNVSLVVTVKDKLAKGAEADLDLTKGTAEQIGMLKNGKEVAGRVDLIVEILN
jgi:rare lipoprotein A (peptidoglycan hydrolase)